MSREAGGGASGPPYAAPLHAVDLVQVAGRAGGFTVSAVKAILDTGAYQGAHFPGRAIYPGVFVLESVRQAVVAALGERSGELPDVVEVRSMRFVGAMHPGERLCLDADVGPPGDGGVVPVDARCRRADGSEVARLSLGFRYEPSR